MLQRHGAAGLLAHELDHIVIPPERRVTGVGFSVVRAPVPPEDRAEVLGLPAVSVTRGLIGTAATYRPARVRLAFDDAKRKGLTSQADLAERLQALGNIHGVPQMRGIHATGKLQMESEPERDLFEVFRPGDPRPQPQVRVCWHGSWHRLDFAYLEGRVDLEYDGGNHAGRREADADRDLALAELQIQTLRITKRMMRDPDGTRRRILTVVEQRRALGLPPIVPALPPWLS